MVISASASDRCASIGALRASEPVFPGQRMDLKEYRQGSGFGGGFFIHDDTDTSSPDDGGYCVVTPKGARWKRALNSLHELNVCHFGAEGKGVDTAEAFAKMMAFSQKNIPGMGVQYPTGTFKLSRFTNTKEMSRFRVAGAPIEADFGYFTGTTLYGNNTEDGFIFDIVARRTAISNLNFEGAVDITAANDKKVAGTLGFLRNTCPGGQYFRVSNWVVCRLASLMRWTPNSTSSTCLNTLTALFKDVGLGSHGACGITKPPLNCATSTSRVVRVHMR